MISLEIARPASDTFSVLLSHKHHGVWVASWYVRPPTGAIKGSQAFEVCHTRVSGNARVAAAEHYSPLLKLHFDHRPRWADRPG